MRSIIGQCEECCMCPEPVLEVRSRSAERYKHGFVYGSASVPAVYLTETFSGYLRTFTTRPGFDDETYQESFSGANTITDRATGATHYGVTRTVDAPGTGSDYSCTPWGGAIVANTYVSCDVSGGTGGWGGYVTESATERVLVGDGETSSPPFTITYTSTAKSVLTDLYSTAQLIADAVADLPALSAWAVATFPINPAQSSRDLAADERTYGLRRCVYRIAFPRSPTGRLRLTWLERFIPEGGGAPTDTEKSYTWDGALPSGYDAGDLATWPRTGEYTIDEPSTDGRIVVGGLDADDEFVEGWLGIKVECGPA